MIPFQPTVCPYPEYRHFTLSLFPKFIEPELWKFRRWHAISATIGMKKTAKKNSAKSRKPAASKRRASKRWSGKVTETSDALDLKPKVFKSKDPTKVAKSLKKSSDSSRRRKGTPLQSAMSMLNFYINRAGKKLPAKDKKILSDAKDELRQLYGKPAKRRR